MVWSCESTPWLNPNPSPGQWEGLLGSSYRANQIFPDTRTRAAAMALGYLDRGGPTTPSDGSTTAVCSINRSFPPTVFFVNACTVGTIVWWPPHQLCVSCWRHESSSCLALFWRLPANSQTLLQPLERKSMCIVDAEVALVWRPCTKHTD